MYPASTLAERTALLHATALEGLRLYGTDITQRMYLVESSIRRPNKVSFCVAVPPETPGTLSASAMQKPWNTVKIMETTYFL